MSATTTKAAAAAPQRPRLERLKQVGFVVRDVEATAKHYWDALGVGPWRFFTLDPSNTPQMYVRGKRMPHAYRIAIASIGDVQWELIQPLDENNIYAEHLARHGEGMHHLSFQVDDFAATRAQLTAAGYPELQSGQAFGRTQYVYFDTQESFAFIAELGVWLRQGDTFPTPDSTYP